MKRSMQYTILSSLFFLSAMTVAADKEKKFTCGDTVPPGEVSAFSYKDSPPENGTYVAFSSTNSTDILQFTVGKVKKSQGDSTHLIIWEKNNNSQSAVIDNISLYKVYSLGSLLKKGEHTPFESDINLKNGDLVGYEGSYNEYYVGIIKSKIINSSYEVLTQQKGGKAIDVTDLRQLVTQENQQKLIPDEISS